MSKFHGFNHPPGANCCDHTLPEKPVTSEKLTLPELERKLQRQGYDLEELDKDSPYYIKPD